MNICAVSATSSATTTTASVLIRLKDEIAALNRRKAALDRQSLAINQGNVDAKAKEQKVTQLQDQIRLIDMQIQMKQSELALGGSLFLLQLY